MDDLATICIHKMDILDNYFLKLVIYNLYITDCIKYIYNYKKLSKVYTGLSTGDLDYFLEL